MLASAAFVLLAAAAHSVAAAIAPLDLVSSLILALPVSPLCTQSSACSALATLAPPCFASSLTGNSQGQAQCACTVDFTNAMESCAKCLAQDPCYTASPRNGPLIAVQLFQSSCASTNPALSSIPLTNQVTVGPGVCGAVKIPSASPSPAPIPSPSPVPLPPIASSSTPAPVASPSTPAPVASSHTLPPVASTFTPLPVAITSSSSTSTSSPVESSVPTGSIPYAYWLYVSGRG